MGLQKMWLAEGTFFCTTNETPWRKATASVSRMLAYPHLTLLSEGCEDTLCEPMPAGRSVHAQLWTLGWRNNSVVVITQAIWQQLLLISIHKHGMWAHHTFFCTIQLRPSRLRAAPRAGLNLVPLRLESSRERSVKHRLCKKTEVSTDCFHQYKYLIQISQNEKYPHSLSGFAGLEDTASVTAVRALEKQKLLLHNRKLIYISSKLVFSYLHADHLSPENRLYLG